MSPPFHSPQPPDHTIGFTPIPRRLLDAILCADINKRELALWLLVARLTYGAQARQWVALRPADLKVIGIGSNHARAVLAGMLASGCLLQNGERSEYRLALPEPAEGSSDRTAIRRQRLRQLVARQIDLASQTARAVLAQDGTASRKGKFDAATAPEKGTEMFSNEEHNRSQTGSGSTVPAWHFSRSQNRFVRKDDLPIDKRDKDKQDFTLLI